MKIGIQSTRLPSHSMITSSKKKKKTHTHTFTMFSSVVIDWARLIFHVIPCSLTARIPGSHPGGPGSTPGVGISFCYYLYTACPWSCLSKSECLRSQSITIPRSLTARIPGSHPGGPGSTPGVGISFCYYLYTACPWSCLSKSECLRSQSITIPRSLTARIPGSHPGGPGSTPGVGISFC